MNPFLFYLAKLWRTKLYSHNSCCVGSMCGTKTFAVKSDQEHVQVLLENHNCKVRWTGKIFFIMRQLEEVWSKPFLSIWQICEVMMIWDSKSPLWSSKNGKSYHIILTKHVQWIFHFGATVQMRSILTQMTISLFDFSLNTCSEYFIACTAVAADA